MSFSIDQLQHLIDSQLEQKLKDHESAAKVVSEFEPTNDIEENGDDDELSESNIK